jgi:signal transduction histidine kinase
MTILEYIKDKSMPLLLHLSCMLVLSLYLRSLDTDSGAILLILTAWLVLLVLFYGLDYHQRSRYFAGLFHTLETLDQRYLLGEIMEPSHRLEDKLFRELLCKSNKSVIEKIHQLEDSQLDYREYIESWIHEVKSPITAAELICQNHKTQETRQILPELLKIENQVESALFYARSDTVYQDYLIREHSLDEIVLETVQKNRTFLIQNQMSIQVDCQNSTVYTDEKWLSFILTQILLNGVKYKKEGTGHIRFCSYPVKNGVQLSIEDQGIGISESELPRIFDKGFTGINGRENAHSTGMGLYLCKKLCGKLGIHISARSAEGLSTTFVLTFPKGTYLSKL